MASDAVSTTLPPGHLDGWPGGLSLPQKKNMVSLFQWEFQDSKLEIPTIYKTYIRAKFQGIPIDCFPVQNNQASTKDDNVGSLLCLRNQAVAMRYDKPKTYPLVLSK